jgi:hypothetical protein
MHYFSFRDNIKGCIESYSTLDMIKQFLSKSERPMDLLWISTMEWMSGRPAREGPNDVFTQLSI